jgi:hypothetical protein
MNVLFTHNTFSIENCSILLNVKSKIPVFEREEARILTTGIHHHILRIKI